MFARTIRRIQMQVVSALAVAGFAVGGAAIAADTPGVLSGAQEVPPVMTKASGRLDIVVGADKSVTGGVDVKGIDSTAAHIHLGRVGVSGMAVVTLQKSTATRWTVPANTHLTDEQFRAYKAAELYVNVHSAAYAAGEIRAQLNP
jgi:hypothetical protein